MSPSPDEAYATVLEYYNQEPLEITSSNAAPAAILNECEKEWIPTDRITTQGTPAVAGELFGTCHHYMGLVAEGDRYLVDLRVIPGGNPIVALPGGMLRAAQYPAQGPEVLEVPPVPEEAMPAVAPPGEKRQAEQEAMNQAALQVLEVLLSEYFNQFPALNLTNGYELLLEDFNTLYPEKKKR